MFEQNKQNSIHLFKEMIIKLKKIKFLILTKNIHLIFHRHDNKIKDYCIMKST
jgi:hypothetical protein